MKNETYIKNLIESYFDGNTSIAEEKELYDYFSGEDVAEELKKYQGVFNYFENEINDELEQLDDQPIESETLEKKVGVQKKMLVIFTAVAACLGLLLLLNPFGEMMQVNPYEGSYAMVNGEKKYLSDANTIEQMEKEIMAGVAKQEEDIADIYQEVNDKQKRLACLENQSLEQEAGYKDMVKEINNKIEKYEKLIQSAN